VCDGTYGQDCAFSCNPNCGGPLNACEPVEGNCTFGCDDGLQGVFCESHTNSGNPLNTLQNLESEYGYGIYFGLLFAFIALSLAALIFICSEAPLHILGLLLYWFSFSIEVGYLYASFLSCSRFLHF
ncbi:hypothetical protein EGW08_014732, partial [Elysia chlorotica]